MQPGESSRHGAGGAKEDVLPAPGSTSSLPASLRLAARFLLTPSVPHLSNPVLFCASDPRFQLPNVTTPERNHSK